MQTSLHIAAVVAEANRSLCGGRILSADFYRKSRAAYLFIEKGRNKLALGLSYHPTRPGTFVVSASDIPSHAPEKPFPFFAPCVGKTCGDIIQRPGDRIFSLNYLGEGEDEKSCGQIVFEAIGPQGNLWHLDTEGHIVATLRHREYSAKIPYAPPGESRLLDPHRLGTEELGAALGRHENLDIATALRKSVSGFDMPLARESVIRSKIELRAQVRELTLAQFVNLSHCVTAIAESCVDSQSGFLYLEGAYPIRLSSLPDAPQVFSTYSVAHLSERASALESHQEDDDNTRVRKHLDTRLAKLEKLAANLETDLRGAEHFERYKQLADIITSHLPKIRRGQTELRVADLYNADEMVSIPLDPKLSGSKNADTYYRKYQKSRDAIETLSRRLEISRRELATAKTERLGFEANPVIFHQTHAEAALLFSQKGGGNNGPTAPRLPYKVFILSTGARIFVGRDGSDNDATTFDHIKPFELWFHAAQCPGSHVGLKFPDKSFEPSKKEIEETAAIAAWFSKARKNKTAPVNYTLRKYVRKPRNSKPGLVTIEREKTVMVTPKEPRADGA